MKKIIIITAIFFFAISLHAQRTAKERSRHVPEKQKSETAVRRSAEQKKSHNSQQATRAPQASNRDISHASRSRTNTQRQLSGSKQAVAEASQSARSQANKPSGVSRSQTHRSTYEKPGQGQVSRNNTGNQGRTRGDRSPNKGNTGTYKGQKPSPTKGTTGNRNNHSVRGNASGSKYVPRTHAEHRKNYATPNRRVVRSNHVKGYHYNPVRYRKVNYHYRTPNRVHVTWTNRMYHDYRIMYPEYSYWYYPIGYRVITIPTYNAYYHIGEVRNVYGRVHEIYYSWTTDEYHLYFGGDFPYHDFTVIISGHHARRYDRYPEMYFEGRYMWVTGLLSTFEGRPELIVKRRSQIHLY